ncbi:MAG: glutamyl-tRNA amidotransferase [Rickettsiales bacterium]|nr:glutamyl-tRNA amidotransferase [Rickettsiales bacterium]|tara:strand:+ start:327 stop:794 length:468 start_codon:yes stop_codon:yes gene_type:complete
MLIEKIKKDLIDHVKSGEKTKISITRLLIAALKDKEISLRKNQESDDSISDAIVLEIINKMIKQRALASQTYLDANRKDLADKEQLEAKLLSVYLPVQLTQKELEDIIDKIILNVKANSLRDMSKVMKNLKENYAGRCDFQLASNLVKEKLANVE